MEIENWTTKFFERGVIASDVFKMPNEGIGYDDTDDEIGNR